eukprot:1351701-Pleurochrysis_carterae.AAC.1
MADSSRTLPLRRATRGRARFKHVVLYLVSVSSANSRFISTDFVSSRTISLHLASSRLISLDLPSSRLILPCH